MVVACTEHAYPCPNAVWMSLSKTCTWPSKLHASTAGRTAPDVSEGRIVKADRPPLRFIKVRAAG